MKLRYLIITLIILSVVSVFIGVSDVTPLDLFQLTEDQKEVLLISRMPRLFSILIAGASMSITGLIMQQLSRNKCFSFNLYNGKSIKKNDCCLYFCFVRDIYIYENIRKN